MFYLFVVAELIFALIGIMFISELFNRYAIPITSGYKYGDGTLNKNYRSSFSFLFPKSNDDKKVE